MKKLLLLVITSITLFAANPIAVLETTQGNIEIELRPDFAPKAVENFMTHI
ncbi:MAG: peptidylprolyl isomerase, partial [Campylobacteraceae bacterium]|nr:peptidylprolyl isomerase [Campylobacteraceae bacterium]